MKLATFQAGGAPELGLVTGETIVPLSRTAPGLPAEMIGLIAAWPQVEREVRAIEAAAAGALPLDQVRLLAPIRRPGKIMAIGLNYADHIAESNLGTPEHQVWFSKAATAANGPFDPIDVPKVSQALDYEAEMVAVVGAGGRHIAKADAPGAVFGYCVGNDATERAWQHRTPQWVIGKSFDTHAPFGPWITTADEIADPHALAIRCQVNGETRQTGRLSDMIWDPAGILAKASELWSLHPGDLIFTGTPEGVGPVVPGDRVEARIDGLAPLSFTVKA